jgi:hypothetical protein
MAERALMGAGGWTIKRRNTDELRFTRDIGGGFYADHILRKSPVSGTPGPATGPGGITRALCLSDMGIGIPMTPAPLSAATYAGTGWANVSDHFDSTVPDFTEGADSVTVTVNATSGSGNITVVGDALTPTTRYLTRRIVVPGAGASGADLVGVIANISGQNIVLGSGVTAGTTVSGVSAKLYSVRRTTATAGATATYTVPAGSNSVGLIMSKGVNGGLTTVSIDNDLTAANHLPTAQQVVDLGFYPSTILTTGGGTIAPTTRVIDSYYSIEIYSIWQALASGLSTGSTHSVVLTVTGIKRSAASSSRLLVQGFGYGTPTTLPSTANAITFLSTRVGTHFPTHELAIDHLPTGGTAKAFVGGNNHGYEYATAAPALTVDGAAQTITDGAAVNVAGSAKITIASDLYHPQRTDAPTFSVQRTYTLDRTGLTVHQLLTAKIATDVDSGYLAMFSVSNSLDRTQVDGTETVYNIHDQTANPDGTYLGKGENTGAAWWKDGGEAVAVISIPNAKQLTGGWSDTVVMASVRVMASTKASKFYARRTGSVAAGDKWAGEATYMIGRLPDGAGNYFPVG